MSVVMSTSEQSTSTTTKLPRVLACVLCQQRKVKCDAVVSRRFPCKNCTNSHTQCVPAATLPSRPRRRRFPERDLLDRVRRYEDLLRQHNIKFEPLHEESTTIGTGSRKPNDSHEPLESDNTGVAAGAAQALSPSATSKSEATTHKTKDYWHVLNLESQDVQAESSDSAFEDVRENIVRQTWDQFHQGDGHLLFGWQQTAIDLIALHPEESHVFRLWQVYLDNVDPLLKVTYNPALQGRLSVTADHLGTNRPPLTALMFSIYCIAVFSLEDSKCHTMFGFPKDHLLKRYQLGCQQALLNCDFLRSNDRECLTALYLYLICVRPSTDPFSLSSVLSIAIRIAHRMGLHSEAICGRYPPYEAEIRRRLWWSLMLFDARICEMADYKTSMQNPTWDCRTPSNIYDFIIQFDMKEPLNIQERPTEAIFAVVRSEVSEFVRHSAFHLAFVNPALKTIAKDVQGGPVPEEGEMAILEKMIEEKYLKVCNPDIPLQFMTIWATRGQMAKYRLFEYYAKSSDSSSQQTNAQRDEAISHALRTLECDTKLITSPLTKGYRWFIHSYFPFPAYLHVFQDLRKRPDGVYNERTWQVVSDNFDAHFTSVEQGDFMFFKIFAKLVLEAWEAYEVVCCERGKLLILPRIVSEIREKLAQDERNAHAEQLDKVSSVSLDDHSMAMPMGTAFGGPGMFHGIGDQSFDMSGMMGYPNVYGQDVDVDMTRLDWNGMGWNQMGGLM